MPRITKAIVLSVVAAWSLLIVPALLRAPQAFAQTDNPEIERGIALYSDLEYEDAIAVLQRALSQKNLTVKEMTEGYRYLALSHVALGNDDEAKGAFKKLLEANPDFDLPRTENPRALDLFAEVKASMPKRNVIQLTQTASPTRPRPGSTITVSIVVVDQGKLHDRVIVFHRSRGQKSFSSVTALPAGAGRYNAAIPGAFVSGEAVEYYVVAQADDGTVLATEGTASEPMALGIEAAEKSKPIYATWWFWAGVGTVLLAGAAVGVVLMGDDPGAGPGDDDATVTISVDGL